MLGLVLGLCGYDRGPVATTFGLRGRNYGLKKTIPAIRSSVRTFQGTETSVKHYELRKPSFSARIVVDCRPDSSLPGVT